ncbi:MAG: hypothetical protein AAFP77_19665 [Bacteroidota bacterium]
MKKEAKILLDRIDKGLSESDAWDQAAEREMEQFKNESFDRVWRVIGNRFDWEKVYKVMKVVDWHWQDFGVPSVTTIQKEVYKMAKNAWEKKENWASGGFSIGWEGDTFYIDFSLETAILECGDI